jgi:pimeloyl-ACP methyl ester carboxylesterase
MLPDLLFVPGLLNTRALYNAQIQHLSPYANFYIGDHTRHSTMPEIAHAILQAAPPTFSLIGLSMGGYISMEILRQAPTRVNKLVLMDTSARGDTPEQTTKRQAFMKSSLSGHFRGVTRQLMKTFVHPRHHQNRLVSDVIYDMALEVGRDAFIRQQNAIIHRIDSRESLRAITCPTHIICGADDSLTPPALAQEMADLIPNATLSLIPDCGHLPPLESPDEVSEILFKFLV